MPPIPLDYGVQNRIVAGKKPTLPGDAGTVMAVVGAPALESPTALSTESKSSHRQWRQRKAIVWVFFAAMAATHGFFLWRVGDGIARGDPDFTVFYTAGKMLREGRASQLYQSHAQLAVQAEFAQDSDIRRGPLPYIHPPFEAVFFLPLTFLPYAQAYTVWNLTNLVTLIGVIVLLRTLLIPLKMVPLWQIILFCLAFFPIFANFHQGQDAILLLLVVTLSFRALDRDAGFLAGCWLGFGLFKFHLIVPLAVILAFWKGRRFLLGFAAVGSAVVLVSLGLVGWRGALQYPAYAWTVVSQPTFGGIPPRQLPNLFGLLAGWPLSQRIESIMNFVVVAISVILVTMVSGLRRHARERESFRLCLAVAIIASVLVGYSTNTYDLSLLVVPLAIIASLLLRNYSANSPNWRTLIAPAIPLLISPLWFFLWMRWERINLMALFLFWWLLAVVSEIRSRKIHAQDPLPESPLIANA